VKGLDTFLKPYFTVQSIYDIMMGSDKCSTPLKYHTNYRQFLIILSGKITVKMTPFRSKKYLHHNMDYDNYEFWSPINIWKPQSEYQNDMDKLKFLEFTILEGHTLYIPPYWWYSIQFSSESVILSSTYNTFMNICANSPDIFRYYLQFHTTKKKILKTLNIEIKGGNQNGEKGENGENGEKGENGNPTI